MAENFYRWEPRSGYYALIKRGGKQFRRSLNTGDRKLAERRLEEPRFQVGNLLGSDGAHPPFEEMALRWWMRNQGGPSHWKESNFDLDTNIRCARELIGSHSLFAVRLASICKPDTRIFTTSSLHFKEALKPLRHIGPPQATQG